MLFYIVAVGAIIGTFIALMRDTLARSVLFVAWISIIVFLCIFSTDIYGYYDLIFQKIKKVIEDFDKYRSAAIFYCTLAALVGTIIGFILGRGRNWLWCKRLWTRCKENPAIVLLIIAWICIALAVWFFGLDVLELYRILAEQILEKGKTADEYRGIAIRYFGIIAGAGAVTGYIIVTARNIISNTQNKINQQGQITESMVQAVSQIGKFNGEKPNIEIRLGGLYSLQRIMQVSPRDKLPIARILYAYVRQNIKRDKIERSPLREGIDFGTYKLPEDIEASLNIISQFNEEQQEQGKEIYRDSQLNFSHTNFTEYSLKGMDFSYAILEYADFSNANLSSANLVGADLSNATLLKTRLYGANLVGVNLSSARLSESFLSNADLSGADLSFTDLSSTNLFGANLSNVDLSFTNLSGANLSNTNLSNTNLSRVNLSGANLSAVDLQGKDLTNTNLSGTDLSNARNLTQEQINLVRGDENTKLPEGLEPPKDWIDPDEYEYDEDIF